VRNSAGLPVLSSAHTPIACGLPQSWAQSLHGRPLVLAGVARGEHLACTTNRQMNLSTWLNCPTGLTTNFVQRLYRRFHQSYCLTRAIYNTSEGGECDRMETRAVLTPDVYGSFVLPTFHAPEVQELLAEYLTHPLEAHHLFSCGGSTNN
jgi:hypothetical protein